MKSLKAGIIWRYVFGEVLSPALLGLGVYVMVFVMNALFELAELAIKKDLGLATVARLLLYFLPRVLILAIPMSILLGILVGVGRLSTDSEVVALRAGGASYWKIMSPALALGLAGWALVSVLILGVEPWAKYQQRHIMNKLSTSADLRRQIKPRVFFEEIPGLLLYADEVHQEGDFLDRVFIYQSEPDGKELVTVASRAQIEYDRHDGVARFLLEDGTTHSISPGDPEGYQVSRFEKQMLVRGPDDSFRLRASLLSRPTPRNFREQSLGELAQALLKARRTIPDGEIQKRFVGMLLGIIHERFALPVACLVFALLGVPLGIINRRGGKASGFTLSLGIAVIYWILLLTGENLVGLGKLSPYVGLWTGNVVLALIGITLFVLRERSEGLQLSLLVPVRLQRALAALRRREEMEWDEERRRAASQEVLGEPVLDGGGGDAPRPFRARWSTRRRGRGPGGRLSPVPARAEPPVGGVAPVQAGLEDDPAAAGGADQVERSPRARAMLAGGILMVGGLAIVAGMISTSSTWFLLVALALLALVQLFGTTLDRHVLRPFALVLACSAVTFYALFSVYEFVSLIDELSQRGQPLSLVLRYLVFRGPWILAQVLPVSCLVATFLVFGVMSRNNEVTAVKAGGTSIYRLAAPVLLVTLAMSTLAYVNQDYLVPSANERATRLKDLIKGRSPRSYRTRERRWVFGDGGRLYNFTNYNPSPIPVLALGGGGTFQGLSVYRLETVSYRVQERIYARTATYDGGHWVLKDGWARAFQDGRELFETFAERRFEFPERASSLISEWKSPEQMDYGQLRSFIKDLRRRGYDVQELLVDLYDKTAFPLVPLTMVILGLPFCFRMGKRGSLYGVGVAIGLVGLFLLTYSTTRALGGIGMIPPFLASWAPNILFAGTGTYLLLRTET
jgi:LPS export ABC transporter permease LptG/LPS export ABC transporter permease LptF